jgi:hypothetical protein
MPNRKQLYNKLDESVKSESIRKLRCSQLQEMSKYFKSLTNEIMRAVRVR